MRDRRGRFSSLSIDRVWAIRDNNLRQGRVAERREEHREDHTYLHKADLTYGDQVHTSSWPYDIPNSSRISRDGWRVGRKLVELDILLENLRYCQHCYLGPVPLTLCNIAGEMNVGLGSYLYVRCTNIDCLKINRVSCGKLHRTKGQHGMQSFVVNTKLGLGK